MTPSLRFTRRMRIPDPRDFQRAFREGNRARGDTLIVVCRQNELGRTRLGLSVGKKIWRSAVRRNRVRRVFREAFRLTQHELPAHSDLILMAARPALEPELDATCRELVALAHKAHRRQLEKLAARAQEEATS